MDLNLPILHLLHDKQSILIAGAGGGFDIFAGLPLYFALREMGKTVHLANYSFSRLDIMSHYCKVISLVPDLMVGATGGVSSDFNAGYYPEGYLALVSGNTSGKYPDLDVCQDWAAVAAHSL